MLLQCFSWSFRRHRQLTGLNPCSNGIWSLTATHCQRPQIWDHMRSSYKKTSRRSIRKIKLLRAASNFIFWNGRHILLFKMALKNHRRQKLQKYVIMETEYVFLGNGVWYPVIIVTSLTCSGHGQNGSISLLPEHSGLQFYRIFQLCGGKPDVWIPRNTEALCT